MTRLTLWKLATVALFVGATACATTTPLASTTVNPGSDGVVRTHKGANGNTQMTVRLKYLPEPTQVDPALTTYVVWIRPQGSDRYLNVGQVSISDDRRATLKTSTPYEDFDVVITGEATSVPRQPSQYVMMTANVP